MTTHHRTCEECERCRQQAGDEAFADMVVLAQVDPEWSTFGGHPDRREPFMAGERQR